MAVDIGLHFALRPWQVTDRKLDDRSRVFWTAYAIEISLAFNLGRPPSIGEEHITTALPLQSSDTASGIHHIKHRRIQARIVSRVYCGAAQLENVTLNQRQEIISDLQHELDMWWDDVPSHDQNEDPPAYPRKYWDRLYHGTTFVIHRVSPLCPHPSVASLEKCIRASGAYIDDVADILRSSHVPLSWMLVQGILFAGLTMLVTARTSFQALASHTGLTFLLIDIPAWSRKCSVSLAIAHERWPEELIAKLEAQFETLADSTLATISKCLTSAQDGHNFRLPSGGSHAQSTLVSDDLHPIQPPLDTVEMNSAMLQDDGWGDMDIFRDFMGMDNSQAFWDIFTSFPELNGPVATGNSQEATSS